MPKRKGRSKGEGYLFKRGNAFYLQYEVNGIRKVVSLKCTHRQNKYDDEGTLVAIGAEEKAKEYLTPISAKTKAQMALHIAEARQFISSKKIPLENVWDVFSVKYESEVGRQIKKSTRRNYKLQWFRFHRWVQSEYPVIKELKEIDLRIALEYTSYLDKVDKLSSSAYNQHRGLLILVFKTLKDEAGLFENPWEKTKRKEKDGISRKILSKTQIKKILSFFDDSNIPVRNEMKLLFYVGAYTGLRLADCCLLKWDNINFQMNLIKLVPRKTDRINREVTIPLMPELRPVLEKAFKNKSGDYILPVISEKYLKYPDGIKRNVQKVFEDCGFKTTVQIEGRKKETSILGFHSFRGSLASNLINNGTPLSIVKKIIGDNLKTLEDHYLQTSDDEVIKAVLKPKSDTEKLKEVVDFLKKQKKKSTNEKQILEILNSE